MDSFKKFITESLKAEDYEAAIVIGFYELQNIEFDLNSSGISKKVFEVVKNNPIAMDAGRNIASFLIKKYPNLKGKKAEQFGRSKSKLTAFWKSHGGSDTTPKTDILIGDMRISLKIGMAQLMSGGKSESTATFYSALSESKNELMKDQQFNKTKNILESFVTSTLAPSQLRPLIKSGENEIVKKAESAHKNAMIEFNKLFEQNRDFKIAFAREAMSGFNKFGKDSNSSAEWMLVASHDGSKIQLHNVQDDNYCEQIADKMKLQARFKTSSRKLKGIKTGEYNFWSVISLIVNAMTESYESGPNNINEVKLPKLFSSIKTKINPYLNKLKKIFSSSVKTVISFLGVEPYISFSNKIKF